MTGSILLDTLLFLYAVAAPGVAIAWIALRDKSPLVLGTVGVTIGVFALPLVHFVLAMLFRTHISPMLLIVDATIINGAAFAVTRARRKSQERA